MADKHIRLDSHFSSVAAFWEPKTPDNVMTGTLTIDDDGIRFITSPEYARGAAVKPPDLAQMNLISIPRTPVLHGFFQEEECTLLQLMVIEHPGLTSYKEKRQSITSVCYRASAFISGMHTGSFDDKCIDSSRYTFTSLAEWVRTPRMEDWGKDQITINIPHEEKEILDFVVSATQVRIQLKIHSSLTTNKEDQAREIRTHVVIEVTPPEPETLLWFWDVGNRLENLFSLLTGASLGMETFFIYRGDKSGILIRKQHDFVKRYNAIESVRSANVRFQEAITKWLSESSRFRAIENLLLGVLRKGKLFLETEFLSLAQALEGFHRVTGEDHKLDKPAFTELRAKIEKFLEEQKVEEETAARINTAVAHSNQTSFRSRLRELCSRITDVTLSNMEIVPEEFIDVIVRTRNFFTHAGNSPDEKKEPVTGGQLFFLNQKMRALLRGVFLLHLGFAEQEFQELIVREATKWK
jgi:hypothetical protein